MLGLWLEQNEGAKFWLRVMNEIRNRGTEDILGPRRRPQGLPRGDHRGVPRHDGPDLHRPPAARLDGLRVLEEPQGPGDGAEGFYRTTDGGAAEKALTAFEAGPWGQRYPAIAQGWRRNWAEIIPFFAFPQEVRGIVYTTNAIEALNSTLRRAVRARGHFPSDEAATKLLTPRYFERVAAFRGILNESLPGGEDDAYQLTMTLEDLSPKLFNALGTAAEWLANAENEEEVAQVAISGRRYMEQLANALFPPTDMPRGKRKLDKPAYRNRLWAFTEDHIQGDPARLSSIGKKIDRVVEELNAGLHDDQPKERVARSISDVAVLTAALFVLNPDAVRNGYLAYMDSFRAFAANLPLSVE